MAVHWAVDGPAKLKAGLVAIQVIRTSIVMEPYSFVGFQGGDGVRTPGSPHLLWHDPCM